MSALLIIVEHSEEIEIVVTADTLRRAGISVTIAGLSGAQPVKCRCDVVIVPDCALSDVKGEFDVVVLPGGLIASDTLAKSAEVGEILRHQEQSGKWTAAICAAPLAFKNNSVFLGKKITSHPSKSSEFKDSYEYLEERVVVDGKLITSRGPGTAFEFAFTIVEKLLGKEKASELSAAMLLR